MRAFRLALILNQLLCFALLALLTGCEAPSDSDTTTTHATNTNTSTTDGSFVPSENEPDLRVMAFNIRWASPNDGVDLWSNRAEWVATLIDSSNADVVGLQEVLLHQMNDIMAHQSRFAWVGVGRDDGMQGGEYSPIMYDSTRFSLISSDTKWLSAEPNQPGSIGWDAALPRVATLVSLRDRQSGGMLHVVNTHFDHVGEEARLESARLVAEWADGGIALGDFNVLPDSAPYAELVRGSHLDAGREADQDQVGTFRTFDPASTVSNRIDYIFFPESLDLESYTVWAPVRDGRFPSDHLPVIADFSWSR